MKQKQISRNINAIELLLQNMKDSNIIGQNDLKKISNSIRDAVARSKEHPGKKVLRQIREEKRIRNSFEGVKHPCGGSEDQKEIQDKTFEGVKKVILGERK